MIDFTDLEDLNADGTVNFGGTKPAQAKQKFPCGECSGTGIYQGRRVHQAKAHCFACKGKGYFLTSKHDRAKSREAAAVRKATKAAANQAANMAHEGLIELLKDMASWNNFAVSLLNQHAEGKVLSEKQVAAARSMAAKAAATRAAKAAEKEANAVDVALEPIVAMFAKAVESGYKKPMYRANGLRIKPGKAGALYVMTEDRMEFGTYGETPGYEGKIVDGKFYGVRATEAATPGKLQAIAADPKGEAIRHGRRTGTCSCCGRELTKHASIDAGIGPICAQKWGL